MSAPFAFNKVEYECRKVCHPIRLIMPNFSAVGRMWCLIKGMRWHRIAQPIA
jgi:hypothetical protein